MATHDPPTAAEAEKVARLMGDIRNRFRGGPVVGCHAIGHGELRALCFTRADGQVVACVAADAFLAVSDELAVTLLTPLHG